ncbi:MULTISPECIES: hypothetical protein [unclassified Vibrio]|uniref:hypothetical protein n=1 Tax=unclassified Vibrio TaxID=2614977 RepID=UPI0025538F8A|nr:MULTISPECIES: hypothetical protein [unclassified Vibrio]MDK9779668.1 hypothetical protein [Vibrio sp. D401a]MDK9809291.1 hypothetical protein [Vibrio sp. D406a]
MDDKLDRYAFHVFRDMADKDYIAARLCYQSRLMPQFLWQGLQAVEKYIKCIYFLQRVPSKKLSHNIVKGLDKILYEFPDVLPNMTEDSYEFTKLLHSFGKYRYLEKGYNAHSEYLIYLDRLVAELRCYCTREIPEDHSQFRYFHIEGGELENILANQDDKAFEALTWQNGFFGVEQRNQVALQKFMIAERPALVHEPELLTEIQKLIHLPKEVVEVYKQMASAKS